MPLLLLLLKRAVVTTRSWLELAASVLEVPRNSELGRKQSKGFWDGWALVTPKTEKSASALAWQQGRKCWVRTLKN